MGLSAQADNRRVCAFAERFLIAQKGGENRTLFNWPNAHAQI